MGTRETDQSVSVVRLVEVAGEHGVERQAGQVSVPRRRRGCPSVRPR